MLIDAFKGDFFDELDTLSGQLSAWNGLYLLVDGAFVPGLHRTLTAESKSLLFASLPGCRDETADASPFLTPYVPRGKRLRSLLHRCSGWPMLSLIETPESLAQLTVRLSAWCVVEADDQRFNFRFPDTRRLPAIFRTLNPAQRTQFTGPAVRWIYINREGSWSELDVTGVIAEPATNPLLNGQQFAALVDDSRIDEVLVLLGDRGRAVGRHPSASHACVTDALRAAVLEELADEDVLDWCDWYWQHAETNTASPVQAAFQAWRNISLTEKTK
jgi:hypothetical protein